MCSRHCSFYCYCHHNHAHHAQIAHGHEYGHYWRSREWKALGVPILSSARDRDSKQRFPGEPPWPFWSTANLHFFFQPIISPNSETAMLSTLGDSYIKHRECQGQQKLIWIQSEFFVGLVRIVFDIVATLILQIIGWDPSYQTIKSGLSNVQIQKWG